MHNVSTLVGNLSKVHITQQMQHYISRNRKNKTTRYHIYQSKRIILRFPRKETWKFFKKTATHKHISRNGQHQPFEKEASDWR